MYVCVWHLLTQMCYSLCFGRALPFPLGIAELIIPCIFDLWFFRMCANHLMVVNVSFLRFLHERGNVFLAVVLFCLWLCLVSTLAFCLLFFYDVILFHQNPWGILLQYRYFLVAWLYFHPAALHHWDKDGIYPQVHKIPCNGMTLSLVVNGLTFCAWDSFPSINAHRCVWC